MLITTRELQTYKLDSLDGEIGKVKEFFFDDRHWSIRYLVADTGGWLTGRLILIAPHALVAAIKKERHIAVNLSKKQIEDSPSWESEKPVSRQFQADYNAHYGWQGYWMGNYPIGGPGLDLGPVLVAPTAEPDEANEEEGDPNLRSTKDVTGHSIEARDGEIGHVEDFVIDDETWTIRYLIVDTRNWWPGKKVLISPKWIERVSWEASKVVINLSREAIKSSPEYTEKELLRRDYEAELHAHYSQRGYWETEGS